jgi:transposase
VAEFEATITEQLRKAIPTTNTRPVQVFAQDESRFGLQTIRRRRITARGVKPIGILQHEYTNCWLYGCVAPVTGERFFLVLPKLNAAQMQIFLDAFAAAYPTTFNILLMDNSGAHTAKRLCVPANVGIVFQPPASPELNPVERVWEDLKGYLAWQTFTDVDALVNELVDRVSAYDAPTIQSLTSYPYLVEAIHAVCS